MQQQTADRLDTTLQDNVFIQSLLNNYSKFSKSSLPIATEEDILRIIDSYSLNVCEYYTAYSLLWVKEILWVYHQITVLPHLYLSLDKEKLLHIPNFSDFDALRTFSEISDIKITSIFEKCLQLTKCIFFISAERYTLITAAMDDDIPDNIFESLCHVYECIAPHKQFRNFIIHDYSNFDNMTSKSEKLAYLENCGSMSKDTYKILSTFNNLTEKQYEQDWITLHYHTTSSLVNTIGCLFIQLHKKYLSVCNNY